MNITAVTAPTRGPDFVTPSAAAGTPIVTAPQPATMVTAEATFTAASFAMASLSESTRKRLSARSADRAPPERYLMATRATILPLLQDIPTSHIPAHLAAQAYQAQRRAQSEGAQSSIQANPAPAPSTIMPPDDSDSDSVAPEHPMPAASSQLNASLTTGGLDVTA